MVSAAAEVRVATSILDLNSGRTADAGTDSEDLALIRALRLGSEQAYETLLLRFQQPVYNLALRLLNDPSDASDVAQEVFLKVFRNVGHFRGQSSLKTWIFRIAINEAHNQRRWFFRHRHREVGMEDQQEDARSQVGCSRRHRPIAVRLCLRPGKTSDDPGRPGAASIRLSGRPSFCAISRI